MSNMKQSKFPPGWDENQVKKVLEHYESQSENEAVAEDEAVFWNSRSNGHGNTHRVSSRD